MATRWNPFGKQQQSPVVQPKTAAPAPPSPTDAKKFGLENFGNTCYANSVLQALYSCAPFRDLLLQSPDITLPPESAGAGPAQIDREQSVASGPSQSSGAGVNGAIATPNHGTALPIPPSPSTLFSALRSLYMHIATNPSDKGTVAPKAFIEKLKEVNDVFRSTMHQDAHEFLNTLLNRMHDEETEAEKRAKDSHLEDLSNSIATLSSKVPSSSTAGPSSEFSLVRKLFLGTLTSETRCLTCETVSSRDEEFLDLSIDIEENSSVTACLRQFSASEMLCQKNKFFCDSCCDLQEAEKRMKIKKLPNVLSLHLKRFKQEDVQRYIKLSYRVAFPFQLRLFNTTDDIADADRLYDLFAIVVHIGSGPHHGHYISIIKASGGWLLYDDEKISDIAESEIPKYFGDNPAGSAYVLYYQAVDIDRAALGLRPNAPTGVAAAAAGASVTALGDGVGISRTRNLAGSPVSPSYPPGLAAEGEGSENGSETSSGKKHQQHVSPHSSPVPQIMGQGDELATPLVPSSPLPQAVTASAASPSSKPARGWFGGLRRTPSSSAHPPLPPLEPPSRKASLQVPPTPTQVPVPLSPAAQALLDADADPTWALPTLANGSAARGPPSPAFTNGRDSPHYDESVEDVRTSVAGSASVAGGTPSVATDHHQLLQHPGKEKEKKPQKKPSWFGKRKSLRLGSSHGKAEKEKDGYTSGKEKEKEKTWSATSSAASTGPSSASFPASPPLPSEKELPQYDNLHHRHSGVYSKSTAAGREKKSRNPLAPEAAGGPSDAASPRHSTSSAPRGPRPKSTASHNLEIPSTPVNGTAYVAEFSTASSTSKPPSRTPPPSAFSPQSPKSSGRLKDKHSLPAFSGSVRRSKDLDRQSTTPSPTKARHKAPSPSSPRPSTATGAGDADMGRFAASKDLPPVPPVPTGLTSPPPVFQPLRYTHSNEDAKRLSSSARLSPSPVNVTGSLQSAGTHSLNQSQEKFKRATRKLSLTAPILGLGFGKKKDKEKDKGR